MKLNSYDWEMIRPIDPQSLRSCAGIFVNEYENKGIYSQRYPPDCLLRQGWTSYNESIVDNESTFITIESIGDRCWTQNKPRNGMMRNFIYSTMDRGLRWCGRLPVRLHRDERGTMSIVSVFAVLLLAFLLGLVMNTARQVTQKVQMQNAADAATYSGGVVFARNMNTLAYTNHLLCDVFALTAFLREGRDQKAASLSPELLDNWERVGPMFNGAPYPPFAELGPAISDKVPLEREMVRTYSVWMAAVSDAVLPVMEDILENRRIPEFQRALVDATPQLMQYATDQVAQRHGRNWPRKTELHGVLWRTNGDPVGGASEAQRRTLPVVDPVMDVQPNQDKYLNRAKSQRRRYARIYLSQWNRDTLRAFRSIGKMSQFDRIWRIFTCGNLRHLLREEYPDDNLPFIIRDTIGEIGDINQHVEQDFMFVGVVYRKQMRDRIPGVFHNPVQTNTQPAQSFDTEAYAQVMAYVPKRRLVWHWRRIGGAPPPSHGANQGGVPGEHVYLPLPPDPGGPPAGGGSSAVILDVTRQSSGRYPANWDLITQNWSAQLVPATASNLPTILGTSPQINGIDGIHPPDQLKNLSFKHFLRLSTH